jgi:phosphate starvation-inducible PhoH-like protein
LTKSKQFKKITLTPFDNRRLADLCGQFDEHLHLIERYLGVEINNRGNVFHVIGHQKPILKATEILEQLYRETETPNALTVQKIQYLLQVETSKKIEKEIDLKEMIVHTKYVTVKPFSLNQYYYLKNISAYDINFGIGPSGTGKTFLAVACAVSALEKEQVKRIILVRPAVEAGEKLGFLPGGMEEKVSPYLRPLYDALFEMMGVEQVTRYTESHVIEIAPLAFMRGRTLNDAFVILDESQNTTKEQMKMFLTRIGFGSKAVITGDITQTDLPKSTQSGLRDAIEVLKEVEEINFTFFQAQDVVRHPLVQKIVQAYDKFDTPSNHSKI